MHICFSLCWKNEKHTTEYMIVKKRSYKCIGCNNEYRETANIYEYKNNNGSH